MKVIIGVYDLWDIVENGYEAPEDESALMMVEIDIL